MKFLAYLFGFVLAVVTGGAIAAAPKIAAGDTHALVLDANGTLWSWGSNTWGQLGDGTRNNVHAFPQQVVGLANVVDIAAGLRHSVAVTGDGLLWIWGNPLIDFSNVVQPAQVSGF